ncbi:MAG: endonuclease/exonuclease/phosphatase family protein [Bacteroidota bacterium]
MGKFLLSLLSFILLSFSPSEPLRLLSYNIRNAKGMDNVTDYTRIAGIITQSKASIIALQELDSVTQRSKGVDVLKELSEATGMYASYGAAIAFQGGKYGVGILSKEKPLAQKTVPLPGAEEARVLLMVEFKEYVVFCTHFSLTEKDRVSSVKIIEAALQAYTKPVFLAGDLNDTPGSTTMQILQQKFQLLSSSGFSFPSDNPDRCIDYILAYSKTRIYVLESAVLQEPIASDHRPVLVALNLQ